MDNPRERMLASLIGAIGTLVGVLSIQVLPEMLKEDLRPKNPQALLFLVMLVAVGGLGGFVGHWAFLHIAKGDLKKRALLVGGVVGLVIGATTWSLTYLLFDLIFPFHPVRGARRGLIDRSLTNALLAGPLGGVLVALVVARRLIVRGDRG